MDPPSCDALSNLLGVQSCLGTSKYLGMPSIIGRKRKATFSFLKDRMWQKINSWNGKFLSKGGKEVLIKSVLQAIPSYYMIIYLIPPSLCDELQRLMNSFWWGSNGNNQRGVHWLSWDNLILAKHLGGMSYRYLYGFNLALLGKQGWKFISNPDTILSRLVKAKYFRKGIFLMLILGIIQSKLYLA